jgi:type IV pilus assembly protein PilV
MKRQSGISLIEVLVSVLVLSIGLLGIAGLQTSALTTNFVSYQYTQAAMLTASMVERMRANGSGVQGSFYKLTAGTTFTGIAPTVNCESASCTPQQQANWDVALWYGAVTGNTGSLGSSVSPLVTQTSAGNSVGALPNSAASITCPTTVVLGSSCVVTVYWDPGRSATSSNFSCAPSDATALRCFSLAYYFVPP